MRFFEELEVGETVRSTGRTVSEVDVVLFRNVMWIHNPLLADKTDADVSVFGGPVVPGPFTLGVVLGLIGTTGWLTGTSLGVIAYSSVRFRIPVRVGDTLYASSCVLSKRIARSSQRGLVRLRDVAWNQDGDEVYAGTRTIMVKRRQA